MHGRYNIKNKGSDKLMPGGNTESGSYLPGCW